MKKRGLVVLLASTTTLLCSCESKAPSGQVVAVVNGVEITRNELAAEPEMASVPPGGAEAAIPRILQQVIIRKIAVEQAKKLNLDQRPDFIAQQLRASETMLGQQLLDQWAREAPTPSAADVSAFIASHPQSFSGHKVFSLDRLVTDNTDTKPLDAMNSMADITAYFDRIGHKFNRGKSQIDSATLAMPLYNQLSSTAIGMPLLVRQGPILQIMAIEQVQDAPIKAEDQKILATNLLRQQSALKKLESLKNSAKISYNSEFQVPK